MKVNADAQILDLDGQPVGIDLKAVIQNSLLATTAQDAELPGSRKIQFYAVALKVNGGGEVDLTPEEVAMVRERIGQVCVPLVMGRAWELLGG